MTVAVLGEALVDLIVGDDGAYRPHLGGSPYNVAIGLARQGVQVSYLSPFSDDTFGDQLHDSLREEKVDIPIARRSLWSFFLNKIPSQSFRCRLSELSTQQKKYH